MLQTSLPIVPVPNRHSSQATSEVALILSSTPSIVGAQHRYYHSTSTGNGSYTSHTQPSYRHEQPTLAYTEAQASLQETRQGALQTLAMCRHVIATLEITRLQKSRKGLYHWLGFWEHLYERSFSRLLSSRVASALYKVDALFRAVSDDLHQLTRRMEQAVALATSEKEILHILERMEDDVGVRRRRRRRKAQHILNKMRANIETIPVKVNDELFDDMKRGVFALDVFCDYHPGDSTAEQIESMWPDHVVEQPRGATAVSPYLYQQWQESAASGAYMPLAAYSSNIDCMEYADQ